MSYRGFPGYEMASGSPVIESLSLITMNGSKTSSGSCSSYGNRERRRTEDDWTMQEVLNRKQQQEQGYGFNTPTILGRREGDCNWGSCVDNPNNSQLPSSLYSVVNIHDVEKGTTAAETEINNMNNNKAMTITEESPLVSARCYSFADSKWLNQQQFFQKQHQQKSFLSPATTVSLSTVSTVSSSSSSITSSPADETIDVSKPIDVEAANAAQASPTLVNIAMTTPLRSSERAVVRRNHSDESLRDHHVRSASRLLSRKSSIYYTPLKISMSTTTTSPFVDAATSVNNSNVNLDAADVKNSAWKLCWGAIGIYGAYLIYGHIQEDIFRYQDANGQRFNHAWLLHVAESVTNVMVGILGRLLWDTKTKNKTNNNKRQQRRPTSPPSSASRKSNVTKQQQQQEKRKQRLPLHLFFQSGATQVFAKVFTSFALSAGLSFPVCVLAKSAKMVPVLLGQMILGGSSYGLRQFAFAILVVCGTALLALGDSNSSNSDDNANDNGTYALKQNTPLGVAFIGLSLLMDGATGGLQERLKNRTLDNPPTTNDFMLYTNFSMAFVALVVSQLTGEFIAGCQYLQQNPELASMVAKVCMCSAIGQSFIFFIISNFDSLVCSTITTTRKILSVLWSIFAKGHVLSHYGWIGLALAICGLLIEVHGQIISATASSKANVTTPSPYECKRNENGMLSQQRLELTTPLSMTTTSISSFATPNLPNDS